MSPTLEELEHRRVKLDARDVSLTEREQALSARPPVRDLAWEAAVRQREERCAQTEARQRALDVELTRRIHEAKQAEGRAEAVHRRYEGKALDAVRLAEDAEEKVRGLREAQASVEEARQANDAVLDEIKSRQAAHDNAVLESERASVERDKEFASRSTQRQAELDAIAATLERQRQSQAAVASQQADLQRLIEQERTPSLDRREEAVSQREAEVRESTSTNVAISNTLKQEQDRQEKEAARLKAVADGLESREALIERREAEVERKRIDVENRERTLKAKQG